MENLRNRINVKLVHNEKDCLKCTSKSTYMSHEIFDNNLVAIRKTKVVLKFNKPAYTGMCIHWNVHTLECAYTGMCIHWNVHTLECAY